VPQHPEDFGMAKSRTENKWLPIRWSDIWPLLIAATLLVFAVGPLLEWRQFAQLLDRGDSVPAQITSSEIDASGRYSVDVVRYEFQTLDGTRILGIERYSHGPQADVEIGELPRKFYTGALNARYLADDPRVHRLDLGLPRGRSRARRSALLLLCAAALVGTFGVMRLVRRRPRRRT
jgi:hypothetical protein